MGYADRNDLVLRFGEREIKQLEASIQAENSMSVDATLQDASEEVDGYIAVRYSLPLAETPQNLKRLVCDIARYKLWKSRASDEVRQRYEDAIAFLKLIANNKASLLIKDAVTNEILPDPPKQQPSTVPIGTTYTGGVFGDSILNNMPSI
ncbi:gp436 family protein [Acinetobacter tibetensis]|uniref:DUF1320 domain-containing protein n=1 Tax=Acinetobacter tibetensis TaxID=2943497 RepID=A0AAE9LP57_9GAMM|nr:DUF1320 domain-containing protein [Acinetobacter tibetensis]USE82031.1 DUF1320 domain-containing protein [Acinetobacter tibetensis]